MPICAARDLRGLCDLRVKTTERPSLTQAHSRSPGARIYPGWNVLAEASWVPWAIILLAAFLRFLLLGIKPPHFDEGINGWFVDQMVKNGFYKYDPTNYHGPLHFYVLFLSQTLLGRSVWALRLPVVLMSIACVHLAMRFEPVAGRGLSRLAALVLAVSPAFVFYGRYSIHEVWLQFFSMMFILGLLGLWRIGSTKYLYFAGIGFAGMVLTKETYIIHLGCALAAVPVAFISNKITRAPDSQAVKQTWDYVDLLSVIAIGIIAIVVFYSGTFYNMKGVRGLYECFAAWFATGHAGNGHEKEWYYWLTLIGRYEWPIALGLLACALCQFFKNISIRYLAIYAVGTVAAYSIVRYKTPWCIISIVWPFAFVFAAAAMLAPVRLSLKTYIYIAALIDAALLVTIHFGWMDDLQPWPYWCALGVLIWLAVIADRLMISVLSAGTILASLISAISLNYFRCTTDSEPYVYVQTYNDVFKVTRPLLKLARANPTYYHLTGHIIRTSTYPLPWMLGDFTRIGYYENENFPPNADADFLIVQEDRIEQIEPKLQDAYYTFMIKLRAYQEPSKVYFKANLFKDFFRDRAPDIPAKRPS